MKKSFLLFFILLGIESMLSAQTSWFRIYNFGYESQGAYSLISKKDAVYMMVAGSNSVGNPPQSRGQVAKFDNSGNLLWASFVKFPDCTDWVNVTWTVVGFTVAKDNSSYTAGWGLNCDDENEVLINKFDGNGNHLWLKTYGIPGKKIFSMFEGITLSSDSLGIVVTGAEWESGLLALKIDSSGHEVWKHLVDVPVQGQVVGLHTPVARMPDDSYKVAYHNNAVNGFHDYFAGLDSLGNVESTKTSVFQDEAIDLEPHPNGNLVYLSLSYDLTPCGGMRVQMLTPQFDTVWTRLFCDSGPPYYLFSNSSVQNLSIAPDGRILAFGHDIKHGALVCYAPDGSLLWKREVAFQGFDNVTFQYAIWADDGGILLDGYIYGQRLDSNNIPEYYERGFLIKLDSIGCDLPGCSETITYYNTYAGVQDIARGGFSVFPNPANTTLTVDLAEATAQTAREIRIFSAQGSLLKAQALSASTTALDISNLQTGFYLISLFENGKISQSRYFVKAGN